MWRREARWFRRAVLAQDADMRLDRWLRLQFPSLPQSLVQQQLRKRKIRLEAAPSAEPTPSTPLERERARAGSILRPGAVVAIDARLFRDLLVPEADALDVVDTAAARETEKETAPPSPKVLRELLRRVAYQDEHYVVLNKPHGLAVQDGSALKDSLERYFPSLAASLASRATDGESVEPLRLVHRLDRCTSGVLVLARSRLAAAKFSALLQHNRVHKTYEALVESNTTAEAVLRDLPRQITLPVDGKPARTVVKRVLRSSSAHRGVWIELKPVTGRKHQLRVHCATGLGAPIVGDAKYGGARAERLFLHAKRIQFEDPFDPGRREIDVTCTMEQE